MKFPYCWPNGTLRQNALHFMSHNKQILILQLHLHISSNKLTLTSLICAANVCHPKNVPHTKSMRICSTQCTLTGDIYLKNSMALESKFPIYSLCV